MDRQSSFGKEIDREEVSANLSIFLSTYISICTSI
jgi:hypothetical protein